MPSRLKLTFFFSLLLQFPIHYISNEKDFLPSLVWNPVIVKRFNIANYFIIWDALENEITAETVMVRNNDTQCRLLLFISLLQFFFFTPFEIKTHVRLQ